MLAARQQTRSADAANPGFAGDDAELECTGGRLSGSGDGIVSDDGGQARTVDVGMQDQCTQIGYRNCNLWRFLVTHERLAETN